MKKDAQTNKEGNTGGSEKVAVAPSTNKDRTMEILLTGKDPYDKTLVRFRNPYCLSHTQCLS